MISIPGAGTFAIPSTAETDVGHVGVLVLRSGVGTQMLIVSMGSLTTGERSVVASSSPLAWSACTSAVVTSGM
jgi:hypothetical protein